LGSLLAAGATGCEVGVAYPVADDGDVPPAAFIATTEPVYYEGHAAYWYHDRWYYRDGARWSHYDREPPALAQRRAQAAPRQRVYEAPRRAAPARSAPRPAAGREGGRR
jgi:hypothetical protein